MFEGRKAKRLGLEDMGKLGKDRKDKAACSTCGADVRKASNSKNSNEFFHWCPKCEKVLYGAH